MRTTLALHLLLVALLPAGCDRGAPGDDDPATDTDAGTDVPTDSDPSDDTDVPPTPTSTLLPAALRDALPRNADGLPVLLAGPGDLPRGASVELAYDESLDDPITAYGDCLALVGRCYERPESAFDPCVASITRCATDAGGAGCCPGACLDAYVAARAGARPADEAVDETFVAGACFEGFLAFRDAEGGPFEVTP